MSWLSDRLKEAEAQLNFRDGGKTAQTVRASRNVQPAVTQSIKNAKYGVLANNPQAQNQLLNDTKPEKLNKVSAFSSSLGKSVTDMGRGIGGAVGNTIQSPYSLARVGAAAATGNKPALDNAKKALSSDANNNLFYNPTFNKTADIFAGAISGNSNLEKNRIANEKVGQTLKTAYGNKPLVNAQIDAYTSGLDREDNSNFLGGYGLTPTSSKTETFKKVGLPVISTGAQVALNATGTGAGAKVTTGLVGQSTRQAVSQVAKPALGFGTANAGIAAADTLANGGSNLDALKAGGVGFATGAALPVAGAVAGKALKPVTNLVKNARENSPMVAIDRETTILQDLKASENRAKGPAKEIIRKQVFDQQAKIQGMKSQMMQGGFIANPFYKDGTMRPGVSKDQIFNSPENKPQFEVSDAGMKTKDILKHRGRSSIETKLSDVIDHKKLFDTYPELADMPITLRNLEKTNGGGYDRNNKKILINKNWPIAKKEKVILHEAQHAIQHAEDFQRGGGYSKVANIAQDRINKMPSSSLYNVAQARSINNNIRNTLLEIRKEFGAFGIKENKIVGVTDPKARPLIDKYNNLVKEFELETSKPSRGQIQHKAYEDILGENVARTVTNRRLMTDAERLKKPFYENMDADPRNAIMVDAQGNYSPIDKLALSRIMKVDKEQSSAIRQQDGTNGTRRAIKENSYPKTPTETTQKSADAQTPKNSTVATATRTLERPLEAPRVIQPKPILSTSAITKTSQQGMKPPTKPPVADTPPQLTAGKQKSTKFASNTVPKSEFVSDKVKGSIKAPEYSVQTEKQGYNSALTRLKSEGDDVFESKVFSNLDKKNGTISRQDAIDAQTLAAVLDGGDDASIRKATQIYEKLSEHYTAAGQLTQAAAVMARRSPEGLRSYATTALKKNGVTITPKLEQELTTLVKRLREASPEAKARAQYDVMNFVSKNTPTSTGDKIVNTWRAGLLTAPTTTGGNLLGNSGELAVRKGFVNPVATAADAVMSAFTGKRTMTLGKAGSGSKGFAEGGKMLPDYLKTGYDPRNNATKYDAPRSVNTGSKALDTYINGVYRLMGVADMPFSISAEKEALSSIAKAEAINKGLKGKAKSDFISGFMDNPPETALARAQKEADYATFKNPTTLGKAATGLKKPLGAVGDFVVPFTQVPASIATRIVERTPIGTATEMIKQIKNVKAGGAFDQRAMSQAIGNGAFGPAIMGVGFALANQDLLTYGYPSDAKERKLWDSEGKQPYSVKVGDRWYSLNYLQPFGTLLAIGGQANKAKKEGKDITAIIGQGTATAGQSIMNQSFLKGIGGALDAISDPERSVRKYVEQTTSSTVPNFVRSFARAKDPTQRAPEGIVEGIKSGIPGVRETTTPKLDMFGQPLPAKDTFANQYLNPLKPSKVRGDNTTAELRRLQDADLGTMPTEANKAVFGKDKPMTSKQLDDLNKSTGSAMKVAYDSTIADPRYASLSDEDKVKTLKKINDVVYGAEKINWAVKAGVIEPDPSKLSKDQIAYLQGQGVDFYPKTTTVATKTTPKKATSKKTSTAKGGKKGKKSYKLLGFGSPTGTNSSLRKILESAVIK